MSTDYEDEFRIFSDNVNKSARSFYYHKEFNRQVLDDCRKQQNGHYGKSILYKSISANTQFWNDYNFSSLHYTVVILGRIFDKNKNSHGLCRLFTISKQNLNAFTTEKLRERKITGLGNADEWIDDYMSDKADIDPSSYLETFIKETISFWDEVKHVRNKFYAHQAVINANNYILEEVKYEKYEKIINRLLTIEHVYWEAYNNGILPSLDYKNSDVHAQAKEEISNLLNRLAKSIG